MKQIGSGLSEWAAEPTPEQQLREEITETRREERRLADGRRWATHELERREAGRLEYQARLAQGVLAGLARFNPALRDGLERAAPLEPLAFPRAPTPTNGHHQQPWAGAWGVGGATSRALELLGVGPAVEAPAGWCALWDSRLGTPCGGQAFRRAWFGKHAYLPVCQACAIALEAQAAKRGVELLLLEL